MGPSAAAVPSSATTPIKRPCERRKSVPLLAAAGTDTVIAELDHLTLGEITRQAAVRSALSNRHCDSTGPDRTLATGFSDILAEVSGKLVDVARELEQIAIEHQLSLAHGLAGPSASPYSDKGSRGKDRIRASIKRHYKYRAIE